MKNTFILLLVSLIKTCVVAGIIAGAAFLVGGPPLFWFIVAIVGQIVFFQAYNRYLEYDAAKTARIIQTKELEIIAKNTMVVTCASCKKESDVTISLNGENKYICGHCNVKNSIFVTADTAVVTEPLYEPQPIPNTASTNGL